MRLNNWRFSIEENILSREIRGEKKTKFQEYPLLFPKVVFFFFRDEKKHLMYDGSYTN